MLLGTRIRLRAVEPADYPTLHRWLNDPAVMIFWGRPGNTQSVAEVVETEEAQSRRGTSRKYMIETLDGAVIGEIDYYDLDMVARSAWTSIMIGEPEYWGGGFGTDAMRTLLRYLFHQLGLHRVTLTAIEGNLRARKSYEKVGFVQEGTLRDWMFFDGRYVNGVLMAVLRDDFDRLELEKDSRAG
jgi:RimJ/RimL family protein N-acetyltransferase